jgi:hypothetical protein
VVVEVAAAGMAAAVDIVVVVVHVTAAEARVAGIAVPAAEVAAAS